MMNNSVSPDMWGNWPRWTFEGELVRTEQSQSAALTTIHQSLDNTLRNMAGVVPSNISDVVDEACYIISCSTEMALHSSTGRMADEINHLRKYLGDLLGDISWSAARLVDLTEQILSVLTHPLATRANERNQQGLLWFSQKEFELAEAAFTKALEDDSTSYLAHSHLGHIQLMRNDLMIAHRSFELASKCAKSDSERAVSLSCWARTSYLLGDYTQACSLIERVTELCPWHPEYWLERGVYLHTSRHTDEWMGHIAKAIYIDPLSYLAALRQPALLDVHRDLYIVRTEGERMAQQELESLLFVLKQSLERIVNPTPALNALFYNRSYKSELVTKHADEFRHRLRRVLSHQIHCRTYNSWGQYVGLISLVLHRHGSWLNDLRGQVPCKELDAVMSAELNFLNKIEPIFNNSKYQDRPRVRPSDYWSLWREMGLE